MRTCSGLLSCCFRLLCCSCVVATSDDASAARRFAAAAKNHLDHGDARAFHAATGTAVEALLAALVKRPQNCTAIASSEKFVPHPLNAKGLHALRALVARKLSTAATRAGQESEIPNFKGSYLGRFPLVSADFWTSDHLSERPRSVDCLLYTSPSPRDS